MSEVVVYKVLGYNEKVLVNNCVGHCVLAVSEYKVYSACGYCCLLGLNLFSKDFRL